MSAPVTERGRGATRARTATTIPTQRGSSTVAAPAPPAPPQRSTRKAYARRDDRLRKLVAGRAGWAAAPAGRAQFVLLVMVLLVGGLVATLWLSTAAAADSYRLQDARAEAAMLSQRAERLNREVAAMQSAPELARRAMEMGMIRVQDPARLLVAPDATVTVVGEPETATPPAPPAPPEGSPVAGTAPAQPAPAGATPDGVTPDGATPDGVTSDRATPDRATPDGPAPDGPGDSAGTEDAPARAAGPAASEAAGSPGATTGTG